MRLANLSNLSKIVILLILISIIVSAVSTNQKIILSVGNSTIINGKNITLRGISENKANIDVDGVLQSAEYNRTKFINGVKITVLGLASEPPLAILNITIDFVCGDRLCSEFEDNKICCTDCNCTLAGDICIGNRCAKLEAECINNSDCNDSNPCTENICDKSSYPSQCVYKQITQCISNDTCCPSQCDTPQDSDCALVDKCKEDSECDDKNPCTQDKCQGSPKRCDFLKEEGCPLNDKCIETGTIFEGKYCKENWTVQRGINSACENYYECNTGICKNGKCSLTTEKNYLLPILYTFGIAAVVLVVFYLFVSFKRIKPVKPSQPTK